MSFSASSVYEVRFQFYEVSACIEWDAAGPFASAAEAMIRDLSEDFSYFRSDESLGTPDVRLRITGSTLPQSLRPRFRLFRTRLCDVYGWGAERFCDYGDDVWIHARNRGTNSIADRRYFQVYGLNPERVYEAMVLTLQSAVGEALDRRGYHRIHALSFERAGTSVAYFAPRGGGKSAAGILLQAETDVSLFSDECALIHRGEVLPFPIRIALHPVVASAMNLDLSAARIFKRKVFPEKALFPIPHGKVAARRPLSILHIARAPRVPRVRRSEEADGAGTAESAGLWDKTRFLASFVLGLGLPQMAEHMLRLGNLASLARIALSRLRTGVSLLDRCSVSAWTPSRDALVNSRRLRASVGGTEIPIKLQSLANRAVKSHGPMVQHDQSVADATDLLG